jgi:hypothetical protein
MLLILQPASILANDNPLGNQKGAAFVLVHDECDASHDPVRQAHRDASERRGLDDYREHGAKWNQSAPCCGARQTHWSVFASRSGSLFGDLAKSTYVSDAVRQQSQCRPSSAEEKQDHRSPYSNDACFARIQISTSWCRDSAIALISCSSRSEIPPPIS